MTNFKKGFTIFLLGFGFDLSSGRVGLKGLAGFCVGRKNVGLKGKDRQTDRQTYRVTDIQRHKKKKITKFVQQDMQSDKRGIL